MAQPLLKKSGSTRQDKMDAKANNTLGVPVDEATKRPSLLESELSAQTQSIRFLKSLRQRISDEQDQLQLDSVIQVILRNFNADAAMDSSLANTLTQHHVSSDLQSYLISNFSSLGNDDNTLAKLNTSSSNLSITSDTGEQSSPGMLSASLTHSASPTGSPIRKFSKHSSPPFPVAKIRAMIRLKGHLGGQIPENDNFSLNEPPASADEESDSLQTSSATSPYLRSPAVTPGISPAHSPRIGPRVRVPSLMDDPSQLQTSTFHRRQRGSRTQFEVNPTVPWPEVDEKNAKMLEECLLELVTWEFNVFRVNELTQGHALVHIGRTIFEYHGLIDIFGLDEMKLYRFLMKVESKYSNDNPYHNATHAADVLQTLNVLLCVTELVNELSALEIMAILIAAIIHDIDHPGVNNGLLCETMDKMALVYNDASVLENHHLSTFFLMLQDPEVNLFDGLDKAQMKVVRKVIIMGVLATDPAKHFKEIAQFESLSEASSFVGASQEDRWFLLSVSSCIFAEYSSGYRLFSIWQTLVTLLNQAQFICVGLVVSWMSFIFKEIGNVKWDCPSLRSTIETNLLKPNVKLDLWTTSFTHHSCSSQDCTHQLSFFWIISVLTKPAGNRIQSMHHLGLLLYHCSAICCV